MAGDTLLTIVGNLAGDPELRFVPSGKAVANFTVASTPRVYDRQANEWKDGDTLWMRCSVWDKPAENVAESLVKGDQVIVQGRLVQRSYDKGGAKVTVMELQVTDIGAGLRFRSFPHRSAQAGSTTRAQPTAPTEDPWSTPDPPARTPAAPMTEPPPF